MRVSACVKLHACNCLTGKEPVSPFHVRSRSSSTFDPDGDYGDDGLSTDYSDESYGLTI